ncbi:MAG: cyclohex-ene-carboxylate:CoA ligase [Aeromicrobium sp.]|nr:cyclohex-ene-carboxylate:CoA ligase [Aeromicrobium sp.]
MTTPWPWILEAPSVQDLVLRRATLTPDAPLLIDEHGVGLTCREFADRVERVAAALHGLGIRAGTRVAWQLPTRLSTALVMFALRRLGAVQAPIVPIYGQREVTVALATSAAQYFLVPGTWRGTDYVAMADAITEAGPRPHVIIIGHDAPEATPGPDLPPPSIDPEAVTWIYFTSGSTGAPKGARHTDSSLLATGRGFAGVGGQGQIDDEVGAMGFPIAHVGGIEYLIAALSGGYSVLLLEAFIPDQAVALFRQHSVTTTGGAPPFYQALLAQAKAIAPEPLLPSLCMLKGGGAPCPPELFREVREVLGVTIAHDYGMTEVPMIAVGDPSDDPELLAETDGKIVPGNLVRILAADGSECPTGEVGEVQVSGWGVCRGYTDQTETQKAFTADGWFRTGDLGRLLPSGHIEVVGRLKDMIVRKGENIAPQEIEQLAAQHPAIAEISVLGIPDVERGELVCAVIVPTDATAPIDLAGLGEWLLGAGLMRQKLPERIEIIDALPRIGLAKVDKVSLRQRLISTP